MQQKMVVVGLGETGWSVLRYMHGRCDLTAIDAMETPRYAAQARTLIGSDRVRCGALNVACCLDADVVVFSPGVSVRTPFYQTLQQRGLCLMSDVDLFMQAVRTPVIGVTGTNGKSTLVTLLAHVARAMGEQVFTGGNLGPPCLDGVVQQATLNILELSSFQLAHVQSLSLDAAILLNLAEDHISWHGDIDHYHQSKLKIFAGAKRGWVVGDVTKRIWSQHTKDQNAPHIQAMPSMVSNQAQQNHPHVAPQHLPFGLDTASVSVTIALAETRGWDREKVVKSICDFKGLPHRLEVVGDFGAVRWINDSKATNADAVLYACRRLAPKYGQRLVLILAGEPKGWTCQVLLPYKNLFKAWVVVGAHVDDFLEALPGATCHRCETVAEATAWAHGQAQAGDCVLFSPGGASFDQYQSFSERGDDFKQCVVDRYRV